MTEIDKMYENAGIKGEWRDCRTKNGKIYEGKNPKNRNIRLCKPRFTAEKQLEIMELFVRKGMLLFTFSTKGNYKVSGFYKGSDYCSDIKEAFANYINNLWQHLTDQEKEEIRSILNENS